MSSNPKFKQKKRIRSNSPAAVRGAWNKVVAIYDEEASSSAAEKQSFEIGLRAAEALCELTAVGPATASAIVSVIDARVPFMSDEAIEGSGIPRKYDMKTLRALSETLTKKADALNAQDKNHQIASAASVAEALWAAAWASNGASSGVQISNPKAKAKAADKPSSKSVAAFFGAKGKRGANATKTSPKKRAKKS